MFLFNESYDRRITIGIGQIKGIASHFDQQ